MLRQADAIYLEEIRAAGLYDEIWQAFAVLLPVRRVGVMGDYRTYENVVALRAVTSTDGMTADWYPVPARRAGAHLEPHHQRGERREPRRVRRAAPSRRRRSSGSDALGNGDGQGWCVADHAVTGFRPIDVFQRIHHHSRRVRRRR